MKVKILGFIAICLIICGCDNIKNKTVDEIAINLTKETKKYNTYHTGFKYYLPVGLTISKSNLYNDEIRGKDYTLYLYADVISYYNKVKFDYEENKDIFYSKIIKSDNKKGYIEINLQENNQYLIEIMYNYAKIEVMVDSENLNVALENAITILRSVEYNNNVIANLLGNDILKSKEEEYNIFNTTSSDSNYLEYVEADTYVEPEVKDEDLIK